jgi:hypothetical protein
MEHRPLVDLQTLAHLSPAEPRRPLSRAERLDQWIEAYSLTRPQAPGRRFGEYSTLIARLALISFGTTSKPSCLVHQEL